MPIVSSIYTIDAHTQSANTRWCVESHTDNLGNVFRRTYLLPDGRGDVEATARMHAEADAIDEQLAAAEAEAILGT